MFNNQLVKVSDVNRVTSALRSVLRTEFPEVNIEEGSNVNDLVLRPMSYLAALIKAQADDVRDRLSLEGIKNSQVADSFSLLQDLASNFLVFPKDAIPAKGIVTFKFLTNATRTIPSNILLTRGDGDLVLKLFDSSSNIQIAASNYIEVDEDGTKYYLFTELFESLNTRDDLEIISGNFDSSVTIPNLVSIYSTSNFLKQNPSQFKNASIEERIKLSLTARTFSTDKGIRALLDEEAIPNIKGSLGIGAGDSEMRRDIIPSSISASEFHSLGMVNVVLKSVLEEKPFDITTSALPNQPIVVPLAISRSGTNLSVVTFWDYSTTQKVRITRMYSSITGTTTCTAALVDVATTLSNSEISLAISDDSLTYKNGVASSGKFNISVASGQALPTSGLFKVDSNLGVVQELINSNDYSTLANNTLAIAANPIQVIIPKVRLITAAGVDVSSVPVVEVKSILSQVINNWSEDTSIGLIDLLTPLTISFSGIATNIEFTQGIDYIAYLPNGKEMLYTTTNSLTVQDTSKQKIADTTTSTYMQELQISDRVLNYFISFDDILVEVM
jgi:hypothetical protein